MLQRPISMAHAEPVDGAPVQSKPQSVRGARRRRFARFLLSQFGLPLVLGMFMLCVLPSNRSADKIGDNIQIALPLAGLGCAAVEGRALQYFGRFLLMEGAIHGSKSLLGDAPLNQRPNGGGKGFPSGHTTAAAFGATALVQSCLSSSKSAQAAVVIGAGFVGTSRVDAGAHTIWQVLAGAALGWILQVAALTAFDRAFRRVVRGGAVAFTELATWLWSGLLRFQPSTATKRRGGI